MRKLNFPGSLILISFLLFNLISCIDNDYDLNDLDTDRLTLGDRIVIPLGTARITADDLLNIDEDLDEISTDAQGNYFASYKKFIEIDLAEMPDLDPGEFTIYSRIPGLILVPNPVIPVELEIPVNRNAIEFKTTNEDERIERVVYHVDPGQSRSYIVVDIEPEFTVTGDPRNRLELYITFPEGYAFLNDEITTANGSSTIDGRTLTFVTNNLGSSSDMSILVPIDHAEIDKGEEQDEVSIQGKLVLSGGNINVSDEYVNVTVSYSNINDYEVVYGQFMTSFSAPASNVDLGGLTDVFVGDDNALAFSDPYIIFETVSNIGADITVDMTLTSVGGTAPFNTEIDGIKVNRPVDYGFVAHGSTYIGATAPQGNSYDQFIQNTQLGSLISTSPDNIAITSDAYTVVNEDVQMFIPANSYARVDYEVVIPFAPANTFRANMEQVIEDVFDEDLIDYIFSGGTAELYGTIANGLPLDFELNMRITDSEGTDLGLTFDTQEIDACKSVSEPSVSPVSFLFTKEKMDKMTNAKDIVLDFVGTGTGSGISMNKEQELVLTLKIRKTGGITINNEDDED